MAVTHSPSHSHAEEDSKATESQEPQHSSMQRPPHSETLNPSNPPPSPLHDQGLQTSQQLQQEHDQLLQENHEQHQMQPKDDFKFQQIDDQKSLQIDDQKLPEKHHQQSGTSPEPLPPLAPPFASPMNRRCRVNKRKKAGGRKISKHIRTTKKIQNLTNVLNPIAFVPKALNLHKHEEVLKRLGLYDFSKLDLDRNIKTDLLVQMIANYDPKKRCSYVNGYRINVNRATLAKALKLPATKQMMEEVNLDSEAFSNEVIGFIEDFVFNWMLLHEESWVLPEEIEYWTSCIRDGHPEKLDSASLIWYKVEKELIQGDKLVDCYYASHLQLLIRSQKDHLFIEEDDNDDDVDDDDDGGGVVQEEKESVVQEDDADLCLVPEAVKMVHQEVTEDDGVMVDAEEDGNDDGGGVVQEEKESIAQEDDGDVVVQEEKESIVQEDDIELCLQQEAVKMVPQEVRDDDGAMVDAEEREKKVEKQGEMVMEVEEDTNTHHVAGFDMNFLQGMETFLVPCGSELFMPDGGKRVMEVEEDTQPHHVVDNRKRLNTVEMWDQKQTTDFGSCMMQMEQWVEKAKTVHQSKQQSYVNFEYNHQLAMNQLQDRQRMMEMIIKSRDEELAKKQFEVVRLERELYLMGDLLSGYREALNDTRVKFSEYRKRFRLEEAQRE